MAKKKKAVAKKAPKKAKKAAAKKAPKKVVKKAAKKAAPKKAAPKKAAKPAPAKKATKPKAKRKPNAAFMAALKPSPALAAVVGGNAAPRTQFIKKIWDYIRKNGLQDATNKRMINADDKLKVLFGKDQVSMFELAKIIGAHVSK
jgi:chromatin remodeling complex protein RSC6